MTDKEILETFKPSFEMLSDWVSRDNQMEFREDLLTFARIIIKEIAE